MKIIVKKDIFAIIDDKYSADDILNNNEPAPEVRMEIKINRS